MAFDRLVLVTRQTELEALVERFQTQSQAEFYLTRAGHDFAPILARHRTYRDALAAVKAGIPTDFKTQVIERRHLPQYHFDPTDVVVALGQDGVVANVAKYLGGQPLLAVNPDPSTIDGVLLPIQVPEFRRTLARTLAQSAEVKAVTMVQAQLSDGQSLRAVNDIFIGVRSHTSARYQIGMGEQREEQSSSGIIVSTGVGSTGWLRSVYAGAMGVVQSISPGLELQPPASLPWDMDRVVFNVREPWPSLTTKAALVSGSVAASARLEVVSRMPSGGVIFGDGVETDYLEFNSGLTARIGVADTRLKLVMR
jgi:NAD kinase